MTSQAAEQSAANIVTLSDEELARIAHPMWDELVAASNQGRYGAFAKRFSQQLVLSLNDVEMARQFAHSELTRNLDPKCDFLGFIRRGQHVTCLYRVRSTKRPGEWLGRMVLGYESGEVRIFSASIF